MKAHYNDNDAFVCAWLSNLMDDGLITPGKIDDRSILDVSPDDLKGYERVHFFAGIGGWDHALNLAGWEGPVWTGSCPCQPLSGAGLRKGHADERHLWPAFQRLIAVRKPAVCFGEQVSSKDGREWLAGVRADLESMGYACGAADLPAAGVGAPHIRQRLWWVAHADTGSGGRDSGTVPRTQAPRDSKGFEDGRVPDGLGDGGPTGGVGNTDDTRPQGRDERGNGAGELLAGQAGLDFWSASEWLWCRDEKARRVEPGIFPLADGFPNRVGILRGAGNAIVPQVAAEFIAAYMEAR